MASPIGYELKRAQDALSRAMGAALDELGLSVPQYATLWVLAEAPGLSSAELARRSFVTAQTMNEIICGLEGAGLVARRPHPGHGRIKQAHLTAAGRSRLGAARRRVAAIEARMVSGLNPAQQRQLSVWLGACRINLQPLELSRTTPRLTP